MLQFARWRGRQDDIGHMYADMCDVLDCVKTASPPLPKSTFL